jgi:hypothetical protein
VISINSFKVKILIKGAIAPSNVPIDLLLMPEATFIGIVSGKSHLCYFFPKKI